MCGRCPCQLRTWPETCSALMSLRTIMRRGRIVDLVVAVSVSPPIFWYICVGSTGGQCNEEHEDRSFGVSVANSCGYGRKPFLRVALMIWLEYVTFSSWPSYIMLILYDLVVVQVTVFPSAPIWSRVTCASQTFPQPMLPQMRLNRC
jgi:hypothetical protein